MKYLYNYKIFENKELEDLEADIKEIFYDVLSETTDEKYFEITLKPATIFKDSLIIIISKKDSINNRVYNFRAGFLFKEIKECVYRVKDFLKNRIVSVYYFGYINNEIRNYPQKIYQHKIIDLKDFFDENVVLFPQLFYGNDNPINEFAIVIRK